MSFKAADKVTEKVTVTEEMINLFAKCTGDYNPVHMDEAYAKTTRFGKRIAHGLFLGGLISRVLAMKLGSGGIYLAQTLKFLKPVYIGDALTIELTVLKLNEGRGIATVETIIKNHNGEIAVKGEATIMKAKII